MVKSANTKAYSGNHIKEKSAAKKLSLLSQKTAQYCYIIIASSNNQGPTLISKQEFNIQEAQDNGLSISRFMSKSCIPHN